MAESSYLNRQTPGVYINELDAFGASIVGVATAVPIFIGYTQFAGDPASGASLYLTPVAISSMAEFVSYFGGAAPQSYAVTQAASGAGAFYANYPGANGIAPTGFDLSADQPGFNLYWQMCLFFANGGGNCYVVSVGSYWTGELPVAAPAEPPAAAQQQIAASDLLAGLAKAGYAVGPTMTVVPEACLLDQADYASVVCEMIGQAGTLQDRMAILDLPACLGATTLPALQTCQSNLWTAIAPQAANLSYGATYGPALATSIVSANDILYTALASGDNALVNSILTCSAAALYSGTQLATIQAAIATAFPLTGTAAGTNTATMSGDGSAYPARTPTQTLAQWQVALDNLLVNAIPVFAQIQKLIAADLSIQPPSGALAGVWTKSDSQTGVWNAPANIALASVEAPLYAMSDTEQGGFNVPVNGMAIDVIRAQLNRGNVVWGARTLDGNSDDYRYIQVRRTLIYIEQSIKLALQAYVFAANDATTWSTVTAAISGFLNQLWQQGGLMGAKPSDAYTVSCGLGSTMTSQNILDGYMIVSVTLQMIHPAEFIELSFTQAMGS